MSMEKRYPLEPDVARAVVLAGMLGLSTAALARGIGVSPTELRCWRTGRRHPSRASLRSLAAFLGDAR